MIGTLHEPDYVRTAAISEAPRFQSAEHWRRHYDDATKHGHRPWPPTTRDELLLADELGLLESHPEWIPCQVGLRLLQLPECFGRVLVPFPERFKERFLQTLDSDDEFASAVRNLVHGEADR